MQKIMRKSFLISLVVFSFIVISCGFFKVDKLKPQMLVKIPLNNMNGLMWPVQKGIVYEMPMRVGYSDPYLIVSEPSEQRIKIFKESQPFIFISSVKKIKESSDIKGSFKTRKDELPQEAPSQNFIKTEVKSVINEFLDIPEKIIVGKKKDFYVVNYVRASLQANAEETQGYFKILHFNFAGEYLGAIGRGGQVDLPFESIAWLDVDSDGKLWVLYQHMGDYMLDAYSESNVIYSVDNNQCVSLLFSQEDKKDADTVFTCEKMMPFAAGKKVIFFGKAEITAKGSKGEEKKITSISRRLAYFDTEKKESFVIFNEFNEENEYLALAVSDLVYMWNPADAERLRVSVYDLEGDKTTNLQPEFLGRRSLWKNVYYGLDGNLYGMRIFNNHFELYGWK